MFSIICRKYKIKKDDPEIERDGKNWKKVGGGGREGSSRMDKIKTLCICRNVAVKPNWFS
jgi:hypothetical protein